jgi:hypothetical protein
MGGSTPISCRQSRTDAHRNIATSNQHSMKKHTKLIWRQNLVHDDPVLQGHCIKKYFQWINSQVVTCVEKLKYIIKYCAYETCDWKKTAVTGNSEVPNLNNNLNCYFVNKIHEVPWNSNTSLCLYIIILSHYSNS